MHATPDGAGRIDIQLDSVVLDATLANGYPALRELHDRYPGRTVRLAVRDTGSGMDAATQERIFEPFFTTKPAGEGTGLGLSVVHGIVQGHEGAITVESAPGKGTTFTLYLPESSDNANDARHDEPVAVAAAPRAEGGLHVLYLDDDEALVYLVQRLLERGGFRVNGYTDQKDALAALRADPAAFDLVVSGDNMPGMSGLDVARAVREIRADLAVVVTSGFIDEALQAQANAAGVREVILKATAVEDMCDAFARAARRV
jgi:two-component system cell cycle sensor histidine kinase/response regulator CckA